MEKDSPSKPSVAELAGRLKGHILPIPNSNDQVPFRRKPPSSLKFQSPEQENEESAKPASPSSVKIKLKNSAMIEKLQANLALSPTTLLPSPKTPEVKLPPTQLSPILACSPLSSPLRPSQPSSEEEDPISFDSPPEGTPLPSFNKTRARLSFKRRPPTRQHRRAAGEEVEATNGEQPPCELDFPRENGDKEQTVNSLMEEAESGHLEALTEIQNRDEDCEKMEAEAAQSDPDERGDLEQEVEQVMPAEALKEDQQPLEQIEGDDKTEEEQEETPQEADRGGNDAI
uniref:RCSD domain containing 1 n=1 Tax=Iconisemion striatum TaxID=60296 RepID=A0A1A7WDA3_9TELE